MYLLRSSRGAFRAPVDIHDLIHTAEAAAAVPAAAPAASASVLDCHARV